MEKKLLLLGLLRRQEMHGYQLNEFIDNNLALCTDLKRPTAYYLLDQMAKDGWISAETEQEGNRPPRRVYRLTEAGEIAFNRLLRENLGRHVPVNFPDDVGMAFLDWMPSQEAITLLENKQKVIAARLQEISAIPAHKGSLAYIFSHQRHHLQAELEWLEKAIAGMKNSNNTINSSEEHK